MFTFVSVPDVAGLTASVSANSTAVFTDMLPVAYVVVGIGLGLALLSWSINKFRGRRGGRRR